MNQQPNLGTLARTIIDSNMYMVLGTADEVGQPWVSPVYYASEGYREFYWASSPDVRHSRNIAIRPQVSIVIFDSQAPIGTGQGVYMSATAEALIWISALKSSLVHPLNMGDTNGSERMWARLRSIVYTEQLSRNTGYVIPVVVLITGRR